MIKLETDPEAIRILEKQYYEMCKKDLAMLIKDEEDTRAGAGARTTYI